MTVSRNSQRQRMIIDDHRWTESMRRMISKSRRWCLIRRTHLERTIDHNPTSCTIIRLHTERLKRQLTKFYGCNNSMFTRTRINVIAIFMGFTVRTRGDSRGTDKGERGGVCLCYLVGGSFEINLDQFDSK